MEEHQETPKYSEQELRVTNSRVNSLGMRLKAPFPKFLHLEREAMLNPVYRETSTIVFQTELIDFLEKVPSENRSEIWWTLVQSGEKIAEHDNTFDNLVQRNESVGTVAKIKKRRKELKEVKQQSKMLRSEMRDNYPHKIGRKRSKKFINRFIKTPDAQKLLFSDRVLEAAGIRDRFVNFSEGNLDNINIFSERELVDSYLKSQDGFLPDYVFRGESQNDLGSVILNQEACGLVSELAIKGEILEPLSKLEDPFNSMDDDEFYKVALLCKVHGLLEGKTLIAQVLVASIQDRAKSLSGTLPKFIEVLPQAEIKTKDPFLEILQQTATTTLAGTLGARRNYSEAMGEKLFADKRMIRGDKNGHEAFESVDLAKQKLALADRQVHRWHQTYRKQLKSALVYCAKTVGHDVETKHGEAALENLVRFVRSKSGVISQIKDFLSQATLSEQQSVSTSDKSFNFPISHVFIEMLRKDSPDFATFLDNNFSLDGEVETTALVCLLIQYVDLSLERRTDTDFIRTFNHFTNTELQRKEKNSVNNLTAKQKYDLSQQIKNIDVSFDPSEPKLYLSHESGVVLLNSLEIEELNEAVQKLLGSFDYDTESRKGTNLSYVALAATLSLSALAGMGQAGVLPEHVSVESLNNIRNVLYGIYGASFYYISRMVGATTSSRFAPLKTKVNEFMASIGDVEKKMDKNFSQTLRTYFFILLLVTGGGEAYDQNKDKVNELLTDAYHGITDYITNLGWMSEENVPDVLLGNRVNLENPGQPEYRILPYNFSGYIMDGNMFYMNASGVLKRITANTPDFEGKIQPNEEFPNEWVSFYKTGETVFSLAEKENIPLEIDQGTSPDYLMMSVDDNELPNIAGYVPIKIFLSEDDYGTFNERDNKISWSPFEPTKMGSVASRNFFVEYGKLGVFDANVVEYYMNGTPPLSYYVSSSNRGYIEENVLHSIGDSRALISTDSNGLLWNFTSEALETNKAYFEDMGFALNLSEIENSDLDYFKVISFDEDREYYPQFQMRFSYKETVNGFEYERYVNLELPYNFQKNSDILANISQKIVDEGWDIDLTKLQRFIDGLTNIKIIPNSNDSTSFLVLINHDGLNNLDDTFLSEDESLFVGIQGIDLAQYIEKNSNSVSSVLSPLTLGTVNSETNVRNIIFSPTVDFDKLDIQEDDFFTEEQREVEKNIVMNDPELSWIYESDFAEKFGNLAASDYRGGLTMIREELKLRGMNYENGNQLFIGNLDNIRDMLRVDPETGQLKNPDQVCNGMSAMVYYVARLWRMDVALMQLNVKSENTSFAGNSSADHMVVVYRVDNSSSAGVQSWQIFEATLPDYNQSVDLPQLESETIEMLEAEMTARNAGPHVFDLATLFAAGLGSAGAGVGLYFLKKSSQKGSDENVSIVIPNKKLSRIFKNLDDAETVFLAHVLQHSSRDGTIRAFWDKSLQLNESVEKQRQEDLKRVLDVALSDIVRFSIEDITNEEERDASDTNFLARVNMGREIIPEVNESMAVSDSHGYKRRLGLIFKGDTDLKHYLGYSALLKSYSKDVKFITRSEILDIVRKQLLDSDRDRIIRYMAREQTAAGDTRRTEDIIAGLREKNTTNSKIEYQLADLVEDRIGKVGKILRTLSRI